VTIENGYTMIHLRTNGIGYLLPFGREDEELHRLSLTVHDEVEHEVFDDHCAEAEHHHVSPLYHIAKLGNEQTGTNDNEVEESKHGA